MVKDAFASGPMLTGARSNEDQPAQPLTSKTRAKKDEVECVLNVADLEGIYRII